MKIQSNDVELHVEDTQLGETTLVFLHHWGGSSRTWSAVISSLRDRYRCVAIDARGSGNSSAPAAGFSTRNHAIDAQAVIRALGLSRYVLVGHSMGGRALQALAATRREGLVGLALIASSPPTPMAITEGQRAQMRIAYEDRAAVEQTLDHVLLGSPVTGASREQLIDDALRRDSHAKFGWIDFGSREDRSAEVARINVPVVIVAGELDGVDPLAVVKDHIIPFYPAASQKFLANVGHLLPVETPDEVAATLGEFVASL